MDRSGSAVHNRDAADRGDVRVSKPTLFVSFSGGRTSGYMCHWLLENKANEYDLRFVFANTGLEHEKTLDFVDRCDREFGLNLAWLEAVVNTEHGKGIRHKVVTYETASRNGEPFERVVRKYGVTNADYPHCTRDLKLLPMFDWMRTMGFSPNHKKAIGIRADEIDRMSDKASETGLIYPLIEWTQVTKADVRHWWAGQPFDLELSEHLGNCVTCWKKSDRKLWTIAKHEPERFEFMDRMEREFGHAGAGDAKRVFFRRYRTAQDILREAREGKFKEYRDTMPELQQRLFDPVDLEADCGAGCEIG